MKHTHSIILILALTTFCAVSALAAPPTVITMQSAPNPATLGAAVTLTATVTPSGASGKVTFYNGVNVIGIAPLVTGQATLTTRLLPAGALALHAYYPGDGTNAAATSAATAQLVSARPQNGFLAETNNAISNSVLSIAVGDFDGDGKPDLAITSFEDNMLLILLGNGNGTYRAGATLTVGSGPLSVVAADFNGDGKIDLAVSNNTSGNLYVFTGKGDGTFNTPTTVTVGSLPNRIAAADLNNDGKVDLIVPNTGDNTLSILLGVGDGTFTVTTVTDFATGSAPSSVAVADFDADGNTDLAVTNSGSTPGTVSIFLGKGDGTFKTSTLITVGSGPGSVAAGDLNGDGVVDLIAENQNDASLSVFLGVGNGTFTKQPTPITGGFPVSMVLGDFNGDGILDVAVTNQTAGAGHEVSVLLGKGDGTFFAQTDYTGGSNPTYIVTGDWNADGVSDLAVANVFNGNVGILLGSLGVADLRVSSTHAGNFIQGQTGATYTLTATNSGAAVTSGAVTVTDTLPAGLTATAISGTGWTCTLSSVSCTRSDILGVGASYPAITLMASVSSTAAASITNSVAVAGGGETNTSNDTGTDPTTVTAASLVFAGNVTIPVSANANVPINLALTSGTVTQLFLTVTLSPNGGAPALTGQLSFTKDASSSVPQPDVTPAGSNVIALSYSGVALTGTVHLGNVVVTIPGSAVQGQSYNVNIVVNGVTPNGAVIPGPDATVSIQNTYLVGDVFPATGTVAGTFGDGTINTVDLLSVLRAVAATSVPPVCSDLFDAMDAFPLDTANTRGGDGQLQVVDLLAELRRASGIDNTPRFRTVRTSCPSVAPQARVPELRNAEGVLEMEASGEMTAIYLRVNRKMSLSGLVLSMVAGDSPISFVADGAQAPSMTDTALPGKLSLAWLNEAHYAADSRVLLGYVQTSAPEALRFLQVSANEKSTGRTVGIAFQAVKKRSAF